MTGQELHVSWSGRHAIVTMPDEIDLGNSGDVDEQLKAVAGQAPDIITADLTSTVFCDSAGVYVLTRTRELVAAEGRGTPPGLGRLAGRPDIRAHRPGPDHAGLP